MATHRLVLGILVTLSAGAVGAGSLPPLAAAAEPAPSPAEVAAAIHFRSSVGFPAGEEFVAATFGDSQGYPDSNWGLPLSEAEADELYRRTDLQNSLGDAMSYAQSRGSYAGVYVDHLQDGKPVFLFTGDAARFRDDLAARLPEGTSFRVDSVERSWADLVASQGAISGD